MAWSGIKRKVFISHYRGDRKEVDEFIDIFANSLGIFTPYVLGANDNDDFIDSTNPDYVMRRTPTGSLPEYLRSTKIIRDIYDLNLKIASLKNTSLDILIESKKVSSWSDYSSPLSKIMDTLISGDT